MNILKPIITEKSMLAASRGVFTFEVESRSTKHQVKAEVEKLFKVNVIKLTSLRSKGVVKRTGKLKIRTTTSPRKITKVWLKKGQSIELFDMKEGK
ncbi:MAG: 50S ribosomal protein L23 [Microgenomates group bacterium GW2011_GWF2_47_9]|nr:MAG: 50S ribosomal protein L23 [Microgenomates group bacterium GW2011_GWF2_47_9]